MRDISSQWHDHNARHLFKMTWSQCETGSAEYNNKQDKEQDKIWISSAVSSHKVTQRTNKTSITAAERSVVKTSGVVGWLNRFYWYQIFALGSKIQMREYQKIIVRLTQRLPKSTIETSHTQKTCISNDITFITQQWEFGANILSQNLREPLANPPMTRKKT